MASVISDRSHFFENLVGICGVAVDASWYAFAPANDVTIFSGIRFCTVYTYVFCVSVNRANVDGDVFQIAGIINVNHQVARAEIACGRLLPGDAGLTEDFVSDKCCPAAAADGCADTLVCVRRTAPILIGDLTDAVGVWASARVQSGIAVDEACGCGILRLQLVQNLGDVGFRNGLSVGQSASSGSAGRFGSRGSAGGLRLRVCGGVPAGGLRQERPVSCGR